MWRVIDISNSGYYVHVKDNNILIEKDKNVLSIIPFKDIHSVIFSSKENSLSISFLEGCLINSIPVIFCNDKYMPNGILLPTNQHSDYFSRMKGQIDAKLPRKKKAWQLIIKEKLFNSAVLLEDFGIEESKTLKVLSNSVLSGDPNNNEAQGARISFNSLFGENFIREDEENYINSLLNYGYTVIRAMVARAVVSRGLNPALAIFHSARINPYALVDDLMEPLRPFVDRKVKVLINTTKDEELTPSLKKELASLILVPVYFDGQKMELFNATASYVMSYYKFIIGEGDEILFPHFSKNIWQ